MGSRFLITGLRRCFALIFVLVTAHAQAFSRKDVRPVIAQYAPYAAVERDQPLNRKFDLYIHWLASLNVPDAVFVTELIDNKVRTIEALAVIHHEKVELQEWLRLGHRFQDVMTVDYYRTHYDRVYPLAHRRAVISEMELVRYYAGKRGFGDVSQLALGLVSPMVEQRHASVEQMARRLRFNPEYLDQKASLQRRDLALAASVFVDGGYLYHDCAGLIDEAWNFLGGKARCEGDQRTDARTPVFRCGASARAEDQPTAIR